MVSVQNELTRIQNLLTSSCRPNQYSELYAAQQALVWTLNPDTFMAPVDMLANAGTLEGSEDCSEGSCHSGFSGTLDRHAF